MSTCSYVTEPLSEVLVALCVDLGISHLFISMLLITIIINICFAIHQQQKNTQTQLQTFGVQESSDAQPVLSNSECIIQIGKVVGRVESIVVN